MKTTLAGLAAATMLLAIVGPRPAAALPIANLGADQAQSGASNIVQVQYRRHYRRHVRRVVRHRPRVVIHRRVVVRRPLYRWGGWGYRRAYWGWGSPYRYSYAGWGPYYSWGYPVYRRPFGYWGPGFGVRIGPFGFGFW